MANRLGYAIVVTLLGASITLGACGDDSGSSSPGEAGAAGSPSGAGTKNGGSSSGGSANGGSAQGGSANGGSAQGGAAQGGESPLAGSSSTSLGGAVGMGGEPSVGGAAGAAGMGGETAAGGGDSDPALPYACGSTTIVNKVCSALVAANCTGPTAVDCADCVSERGLDRAGFEDCAACLGEYDKFLQCGIDAYENHNLSVGIECFEVDVGVTAADMTDACAAHLQSALDCDLHQAMVSCPAVWPIP